MSSPHPSRDLEPGSGDDGMSLCELCGLVASDERLCEVVKEKPAMSLVGPPADDDGRLEDMGFLLDKKPSCWRDEEVALVLCDFAPQLLAGGLGDTRWPIMTAMSSYSYSSASSLRRLCWAVVRVVGMRDGMCVPASVRTTSWFIRGPWGGDLLFEEPSLLVTCSRETTLSS